MFKDIVLDPAVVDLIVKVLSALLGLFLLSVTRATHLSAQKTKTEIQSAASNLTHDQLLLVESFIAWGVKAAEQFGLTGKLKDIGTEKKQWVIRRVQDFVEVHGIKVDVKTIEMMIEAAILDGVHEGPVLIQGEPINPNHLAGLGGYVNGTDEASNITFSPDPKSGL